MEPTIDRNDDQALIEPEASPILESALHTSEIPALVQHAKTKINAFTLLVI